MYKISKRMEIAGAHQLCLSYSSPCERLHGHNWVVTVHCKAEELNQDGMIVDFAEVKRQIHGVLDHRNLNELFKFNPTAENMCKWIADTVTDICDTGCCYKVEVQESEGNIAIWELEEKEC